MAEIRTFIAVHVIDAIIARMIAVQQALRCADADVSWARPEGMHLTLKFLGNVPETRIEAIGDALATVAARHAPFTAAVAGTGAFPTLARARVVWAGVTQGAEALGALAHDIEGTLAALEFEREHRPFNAHLTLGRVKSPRGANELATLLTAHANDVFGEMPVTEIVLMRSDLHPDGAQYTALRRAAVTGQ